MFRKQTLRIAVLTAGLTAMTMGGMLRAADDSATPTPAPTAPTTRRARPSPADMIKNYRDQFEGLNLSDDQMKKIDGFVGTAETEINGLAGKTDQESRRAAFTAFRKLNEDVQSVLTDTQKTALAAKRRQQMMDRFKAAYTAPALKLTDDQTTKINAIFADMSKESAALDPSDPDARTKRRELMTSTREKLNAVLTPEQQKEIPQFGGGRRGNRGGQGGAPGTPPA